jgi:hypothetical protein
MTTQIDQDIDPVASDQFGGVGVTKAGLCPASGREAAGSGA